MSQSHLGELGVAVLALIISSFFSSVVYAKQGPAHEPKAVGISKAAEVRRKKTPGVEILVGVKVYLEGAVSAAHSQPMRTDLWARNLLDTIQNPTPIPQTPCRDGHVEKIDANAFSTVSSKPVDWVCVELREISTPHIVRSSFTGVLMANGYIVRSDRNWPRVTVNPNLQYHLVVYHKSHLAVASHAMLPVHGTPRVLFHDFTKQASSPFPGSNQKLIKGNYVMYAGDVNQDNYIDGSDVVTWANGNGNWLAYLSSDVNLDGDASGLDSFFINANDLKHTFIPR